MPSKYFSYRPFDYHILYKQTTQNITSAFFTWTIGFLLPDRLLRLRSLSLSLLRSLSLSDRLSCPSLWWECRLSWSLCCVDRLSSLALLLISSLANSWSGSWSSLCARPLSWWSLRPWCDSWWSLWSGCLCSCLISSPPPRRVDLLAEESDWFRVLGERFSGEVLLTPLRGRSSRQN